MLALYSSGLRTVVGTVPVAFFCALTALRPGLKSFDWTIAARQAASASQPSDGRLITPSSMGSVRLNMTLDAVRQLLPTASFERGSDGDGAALVRVRFGQGDSLVLWADEDDPDAPIDWSRQIITIYTFSETFHTIEGVRPGTPVVDAVRVFGPVREVVVSEIESRQFITFERQPSWLTFRLDYTGIFPPGARATTQVQPGAKLVAIYISSRWQ